MANSLFNTDFQSQGNFQLNPQYVQFVNSVRNGGNVGQMLQQYSQNNPQLSSSLAQLNTLMSGNVNLQQLFYSMCQQQGVNPQSVLSALNTIGV